MLTTERTLRRGEEIGRGADGAYHRLTYGPGEPRLPRLELSPGAREPAERTSLLHFAHFTDLHILDPESPGRLEFVQRYFGPRVLLLILPSYRPQEVVNLHACEAMVRTVNAIRQSPETGAPLQFAFFGGDNTDNAQLNELLRFTGLVTGETVPADSNGRSYHGVAAPDWEDPHYWHPDPYPDYYKQRWGYLAYPDLLDEAVRLFQAQGIRCPWLSCLGNHDGLVLGGARPNQDYDRILTGSHKPQSLPDWFDPVDHLYAFISNPEVYLLGPGREVAPEPTRRTYHRPECVEMHLHAGGRPGGHGFTSENLERGTAYYTCDDYPNVRLVTLDTVNPGGFFMGSIGLTQLGWLEERLIEAHSRYYTPDGSLVQTGFDDRLVVICSHHGLDSLTNLLAVREDDFPRRFAPEVESLLHRFPNVILWISGHTHRNQIQPRPDPAGRTTGFWDVTTSSIVEWPSQVRLVELVSNGNGTLSVLCTMVDHEAAPDPRNCSDIERLASIHRELAANDPYAGIDGGKQGTPDDRNVELVIPSPF